MVSAMNKAAFGRERRRNIGHPDGRARWVTLPGDGIGPEIVAEAVEVLRVVARTHGHVFTFDERLMGGCAIDETGDPLPESTLEACRARRC